MKTVNKTFDPSELKNMEVESDSLENVTGGNKPPTDIRIGFPTPDSPPPSCNPTPCCKPTPDYRTKK